MGRFDNLDGTVLTLGAIAVLGLGGLAARRGSRSGDVPHYAHPLGGRFPVPWFTAEYVEDADVTTLADEVGEAYSGFVYLPTDDEVDAIHHLGGRYSSTEYLVNALHEVPQVPRTLANANQTQPAIVISANGFYDFKRALWADGGTIPGLSDNTALHRLAWIMAPHGSEAEELAIVAALEQAGHSDVLLGDPADRQELIDGSGEFWGFSTKDKVNYLIQSWRLGGR
jgi:hypothetical protein